MALFAQDSILQKNSKGDIEIAEVVIIDSFPSVQFYFNSKLFIEQAFSGVKETAQLKDEKAKSVATKGSFPVTIINGDGVEIKAKVYFTLLIQSKENMYRYTINDLYFGYTEITGITSYASFNDRRGILIHTNQWKQIEQQAKTFFASFTETLKETMQQKEILCKEWETAIRKNKA